MKLGKFLSDTKNINFLRLWLAQFVSQFGDRINQMALVGLVAQRFPNSAIELAKILAFTILPVFIIQPFAGVYVDRWDRRRTLFVCDIIRGLLVLTIPFIFMFRDSMIPIYIVVFFIFSFSRLYIPAKMSFIPDLVDKEHLLMANSLMTTTGMIAFALGASLGGFLIEKLGPRSGFIWDAMTFFLSAVLVLSIDMDLHWRLNPHHFLAKSQEMIKVFKKSFFEEMREGFQYIVNHREIRLIINMLYILLSAAGAIYVVAIVFIQESFGSITKDLGLMAVVLGFGLTSGALLYGKFARRIPWYTTIFFCLLLGGVMLVVFSYVVHLKANFKMACLLAMGFGMIVGPIFLAANTVAMKVSDEKMRGKVFSALEIVIHLAFLFSMLVSSWLSDFIPRVWILVGVGVLFSLIGIFGLVFYRKGRGLAFSV